MSGDPVRLPEGIGAIEPDIMAQTILDDAVAALSEEFACVDWVDSDRPALAPTGERFVTIASGGEKAEGARTPGVFISADAAVADWLAHVHEHARRRCVAPGATLYWRIKPEIDERVIMQKWHVNGPEQPGGWYEEAAFVIYSRLLISDKPVTEARATA